MAGLLYGQSAEERLGFHGMSSGRDVDLVCGVCDAVFARVHVRPLALGMVVNSLITGGMLMPRPGYSINEEARQRLVKARAAAEAGDVRAHDELECARSVSDYLRSHGGEIGRAHV